MRKRKTLILILVAFVLVLLVALGPGYYKGELGGSKFTHESMGRQIVLEFDSRWNAHWSRVAIDGGGIGRAITYSQVGDVITTEIDVFEGKRTGTLSNDRQSLDFGDGLVMLRK